MRFERCGAVHPRAAHIVCHRVKDHQEMEVVQVPERHISDRGTWWTDDEEAVA